jgi:hypothetical protein
MSLCGANNGCNLPQGIFFLKFELLPFTLDAFLNLERIFSEHPDSELFDW